MVGKILPLYSGGAVQTTVILGLRTFFFTFPLLGKCPRCCWVWRVYLANLALGFTFSTIAQTQMQAMQMTFFFFLPSILLSGFMFPLPGECLVGAQTIGEVTFLTHFQNCAWRMLKGNDLFLIQHGILCAPAFIIVVGAWPCFVIAGRLIQASLPQPRSPLRVS